MHFATLSGAGSLAGSGGALSEGGWFILYETNEPVIRGNDRRGPDFRRAMNDEPADEAHDERDDNG
jgi:hypothetical protein